MFCHEVSFAIGARGTKVQAWTVCYLVYGKCGTRHCLTVWYEDCGCPPSIAQSVCLELGVKGCAVGCVAVLGLLFCGFGPGRHGCLKPTRTCCDARYTCEFGYAVPCMPRHTSHAR
ncbi:hypothetical protein D805_1061 [Bifidobacterium thermophilum RBL67]|uniref:Uncharacterized protein n=1 Tax=Bifidobacterium thermophilum RBL67 TaxID=1254439 RepID=M4RFJ0_9BIFI|nr:hypothetical protein D805_1061 [Bifidobacterium thermophilum RBL67]